MRALDAHRTQHTLTYTDPESKMVVRCEAVAYDDFPVVEWTVYLRNDGTGDSPLIENLQAVDMTDAAPGRKRIRIASPARRSLYARQL